MAKFSKIKGPLSIAAYAVFLLLTFNLRVVDALSSYAVKGRTVKIETSDAEYTVAVLYSESELARHSPTTQGLFGNTLAEVESYEAVPMRVATGALAEAAPKLEPERKPEPESKASFAANESKPQGLARPQAATQGPTALDFIQAIKDKKWEYAELIDRYIVRYDSDTYIVLTIRPDLQEMLEDTLAKYDTRLSVGIIQDPYTGHVLAMSSSNRNQVTHILDEAYKTDNWALQANFPVASIFKFVTAAAGIDTGKMTQNSNFLSSQKQYMKVWKAFANSHNGVFGRMARQITKEPLERYALLFGFNRPFFFDLPVSKSVAEFPANQTQIEESAAGLNKNFLVSPIHVSSMVSTIINEGVNHKPVLVDYVVRGDKAIFKRKPFVLTKPIKPETAKVLTQMMYGTTAVGTGKKGFGGYKTCPNLAKYSGGKTGTLTGSYPNYLYTWFGGFTKISGETLAITTLVGQNNHSATKAASVAGQIAFELFKKGKAPEKRNHVASR
jgi:peptidoglycan glycosyltransferase